MKALALTIAVTFAASLPAGVAFSKADCKATAQSVGMFSNSKAKSTNTNSSRSKKRRVVRTNGGV